MKCYICNREDELINYNKVHHDFDPCGTCEAVIQECLDGYPSLEKDEVLVEG